MDSLDFMSAAIHFCSGAPGWISWHVIRLQKRASTRRPLSPPLFILCIDVLYRMLQLAVASSSLPAVGIGEVQVHTLQFADDILLFFDESSRSVTIIKIILDTFSASSGLKINYNKSSLIPIHLPSAHALVMASSLGCSIQSFPLTYLGLSLSPRALHKAEYLSLIEKISNRLAGWKGMTLSRGGRLILLNSVLTTIPSYYCSAFLFPAWVLKERDKIWRGFFWRFWRGNKLKNGFHCLVNWE